MILLCPVTVHVCPVTVHVDSQVSDQDLSKQRISGKSVSKILSTTP